jgi:Ca2+-binding RTX toxin-like protein
MNRVRSTLGENDRGGDAKNMKRLAVFGIIVAAVFAVGSFASAIPTFAYPNHRLTCFGKTATIVGTTGNDVLLGTSGDDVIVGLAGNDYIEGRGGVDLICGGKGNDVLIGDWYDYLTAGIDRADGGEGLDYCEADIEYNCE